MPVRIVLTVLLAAGWAAAAQERSCYAILVGRAASADGSVLMAHNEDDGGGPRLLHWKAPRRKPPAGAEVALLRGGTLPEAEETYAYLWSQMPGYHYSDLYLNEFGVAVASDACPSREDRPELVDGGIGFLLRRLVAERARTAREGVDLAVRLVRRFGYAASGRTLVLADPQEAWVLCLVKGKRYVAARVPDDRVLVVANSYPLHRVNLEDKENWRVSPDLVEYARRRGWYDPERDGPFSFALAYAAPRARLSPRNYRRQWRGIALLAKEPPVEDWRLPAFFVPKKKLTPADLMAVLRDHYEGTPYDLTEGYRTGSPHATAERPICIAATRNGVVFQLRAHLPPAVGALMWIAMGPPDATVFLPWYAGVTAVPPGFAPPGLTPARAFERHFDPAFRQGPQPEGYAALTAVAARLEEAYGERIQAVRSWQRRLERGFFALQPEVEAAAVRLHRRDPRLAAAFLTAYTAGQTARAVAGAKRLVAAFTAAPARD